MKIHVPECSLDIHLERMIGITKSQSQQQALDRNSNLEYPNNLCLKFVSLHLHAFKFKSILE